MKRITIIFFTLIVHGALFAQSLVSKTLIASYTKEQIDSVLTANGVPTIFFTSRFGVDAYEIIYNTANYDSTTKIASGLLAIPHGIDCDLALINYCHGTTSVQEDVPSRLNGEGLAGLVSASNGYVMCEPDYLGMGDSPWPHYYLRAYTMAMSSINLIRAAREACQDLGVQLNSQLYLTGYSQGGYATMAAHMYMETYFPNEFDVTKSFPGAGSYDMSGAMVDLMLSDVDYPSPGYLPFLLFTWNPIYHLFNDPSEYLKAPYDSTLPPLVDGLHSIDDLNDYMPDTPKLIFKSAVVDTFANNPNHPLRQALYDNDVYRWVPQAPMLMVHCANDGQVPIQNTRNAYHYFIQHGATKVDTIDLDPSLGHGDCGEYYLVYLKGIMDSIAGTSPCLVAAGVEQQQSEVAFQAYPNPVAGSVRIELNEAVPSDYFLFVTDLTGKKLLQQEILKADYKPETQFDLSALTPGVYLLKAVSGLKMGMKKVVVLR